MSSVLHETGAWEASVSHEITSEAYSNSISKFDDMSQGWKNENPTENENFINS